MQIINETGTDLLPGRYWAIGEVTTSVLKTKPQVCILELRGEAPCMSKEILSGHYLIDTVRIIEPIKTPDKVVARLEERVVANGKG